MEGPLSRRSWYTGGSGRVTKGRAFPLLPMLTNELLPCQNSLSFTQQPLEQNKHSPKPVALQYALGKENNVYNGSAEAGCNSAGPAALQHPPSSSAPALHTPAQEAPVPFVFQTSSLQCRRTARLKQKKGSGRITQLRSFQLLLAMPPPPVPPAPSPPPVAASPNPILATLCLLPPPESPHFLTHHSPMEGVPERITPGRPLNPKSPNGPLPLALNAPGSPIQSSGSASLYSWPTPMEGMPERSLGLTGRRPPRPVLSPLPATPVAYTPVEGVPEKGDWGRLQASFQRSGSNQFARTILASQISTPVATPAPADLHSQLGTRLHAAPNSAGGFNAVAVQGLPLLSPGGRLHAFDSPGLAAAADGGQKISPRVAAPAAPNGAGGSQVNSPKQAPHTAGKTRPADGGFSFFSPGGREHAAAMPAGAACAPLSTGGGSPLQMVLVGGGGDCSHPAGARAGEVAQGRGGANAEHDRAGPSSANPAAQAPTAAAAAAAAHPPTPQHAACADMGAQTGLSLGRPPPRSSGAATPAASLRAAGSLFNAGCSTLANTLQPPRSSVPVRAEAGASTAHGGGPVALAAPVDGGCMGESDDDGSWPSCPCTAETIRSLHLEDQHSPEGEQRGGSTGRGSRQAGQSGGQQASAPQSDHGRAGEEAPNGLHGSLGSRSHGDQLLHGDQGQHESAAMDMHDLGGHGEGSSGDDLGGGERGDPVHDLGGAGKDREEQEESMDLEGQLEIGFAMHYGDDEHDELVGGGHMDKQSGQGRGTKRPAGPSQQRKSRKTNADELARQRSLTDAGMVEDDTGIRRSSRPRIKPLEYWRNERKRYGREFKSLPTVLGIETRTPNSQWPALSTGHVQKKSRARTKARSKSTNEPK